VAWPERRAQLGLVNLLSDDAKLECAGSGMVLGNVPPTTRRFSARGDVRMVEAHHHERWGAFAHLSTPLGYIGNRTDWGTILEKIEEGLLIAGTKIDYDHDISARLFPFTPEYIQPGTLRGRERIVTTRGGTHGWTSFDGRVRMFRYDGLGRESEASWPTKHRRGGTYVRVRIAPGEAAVIERDEP
jgi:hypothetical protein